MPHIHERLDYCVEVFIVYRDRVLLRRHDKHGYWLSIGGHIELGEDPIEAAHREIAEEVGLTVRLIGTTTYTGDEKITVLPAPISLIRHKVTDIHAHVVFVYYAEATHDAVVPEKPADVWEWYTKEEIRAHSDLLDNVRFYALGALASVQHGEQTS